MKGRFNRFVRFFKPEITIIKTDKAKDEKIEKLVRSEENLKTERKGLIQKIRDLERRVSHYESRIERLTDAVYLMIGNVELDPVIKRQVEAKLK